MKKKTLIVSIVLTIVVFIGVIVLLFSGKEKKGNIVLSCETFQNIDNYATLTRNTKVYEKDNDITFEDSIEAVASNNSEEVIKALDLYFSVMYKSDQNKSNDFLSYTKDENKFNLSLTLNLSEYTAEELEKLIGFSGKTIDDIKKYLEGEGMICKRY